MAGKGTRDDSGLLTSRVAYATNDIIDLQLLLPAFAFFDIYSGRESTSYYFHTSTPHTILLI